MGERVVEARQISVNEIVRSSVEQAVLGARRHHLHIALRNLPEAWIVLRQQYVCGMAPIACPASPPGPLIVPAPPAVIPSTVREHKLHVGSHSSNGVFQYFLIGGQGGIQREPGQGFLDVIAQVDWPKAFWAEFSDGVTFSIDKVIRPAYIAEAGMSQGSRSVE